MAGSRVWSATCFAGQLAPFSLKQPNPINPNETHRAYARAFRAVDDHDFSEVITETLTRTDQG